MPYMRAYQAGRWSVTLMCASLSFLAGCHRNISGYYLASDNSAVLWLQVVRTSDNHLTGQLAAKFLKPNGSIEQDTVEVSGAVDGENFTIEGSRLFGLNAFVLSGKL